MGDRVAVSFPNMGIDLDISRVAFKVFNFPIYWYGILIAAAFLIGIFWAMKDSPKFGLEPDTVIDLMLFAVPAAIICARLYYVIFSWNNYKDNLKDIFNVRLGGLAIYGGIIGAVVAAYFVAKHKKIPTFKFFDVYIPYVALGQAIGRWGNFFNQEAFGINTSLPWGMKSPVTQAYLSNMQESLQKSGIIVYPDLPVHPTFLYESILDFIVFGFLLWVRKKKKFDGEVFCLYFVTYSLGRAFIEGLRTDSLMLGNLRVSQLLSVVLVIVFGIFVIYKRAKIKNEAIGETGNSQYAEVLRMMEKEESQAEQQEKQPESQSDYNSQNNDISNNQRQISETGESSADGTEEHFPDAKDQKD